MPCFIERPCFRILIIQRFEMESSAESGPWAFSESQRVPKMIGVGFNYLKEGA